MPTPVKVGDRAPSFTLPDQSGTSVNLADLIGKSPIVLYFYPKDDTPGCTKESCAFRDRYEDFQDLGATVIGISGDSPESHQQFATKHNLPFTLLADTGNTVRKLYGVPATLFILPGRVTYIIDQEGIVRHIFDSKLAFDAHVEEALKVVKGFT
ncbi:MAG: peroxiredoxin, partial [Merismopedia sp. SIO2A8]|nr:peroxiredoxin [Merismopedia sp. SIO2A8]